MTDVQMKRSQTPFIIWTMQRTGGTNFTNNLISLSGLPAHHEPFNRPRIYGHLTKKWESDRDDDALATEVGKILEEPSVIKHCVEMVPWRISATLAQEANAKGYGALFLVRDPFQRMLSREYAVRTKVWGPGREKPDEQADPAFDKPLDVGALLKHEKMGIDRLNQFWRRLSGSRARRASISFEQLYEAAASEAKDAVSDVFNRLSLSPPDSIEAVINKMRGGGDQGTNDRYQRFVGIEELADRVKELPSLVFSSASIQDANITLEL